MIQHIRTNLTDVNYRLLDSENHSAIIEAISILANDVLSKKFNENKAYFYSEVLIFRDILNFPYSFLKSLYNYKLQTIWNIASVARTSLGNLTYREILGTKLFSTLFKIRLSMYESKTVEF